ncbi:neurexin-3 [Trichonephila clavata]|uniref:Neurexin-3 n=1 Tax=Trichonephila clavata TaxID=2740835 RepID=A0A8X6GM90_TRICU|nr:neurexin-3 [Trichonephila clavata]
MVIIIITMFRTIIARVAIINHNTRGKLQIYQWQSGRSPKNANLEIVIEEHVFQLFDEAELEIYVRLCYGNDILRRKQPSSVLKKEKARLSFPSENGCPFPFRMLPVIVLRTMKITYKINSAKLSAVGMHFGRLRKIAIYPEKFKKKCSLCKELSGQNINLDFQVLYIGSMGTEKPPTSLTSASSNKEIPNFVGHMQHFIFNGQHFFDMARSGQMTNFKVTAKFGKKDEIVHHPVTFKSKFTFIGLSQLKAYSSMNLYFQFKTLEPNGLILFNGGKGQDFIAIELVDGHLHYIFNLGDGPRKVRSNTRTTLNDNQWHAVTIGKRYIIL